MDIQSIYQTWVRVLTKPGEEIFAAEREKSSATLSTALLWVFAASVIAALLGVLQSRIFSTAMGGFDQVLELMPPEFQDEIGSSVSDGTPGGPAFSISFIFFGPLLFLIGTGIYHVLASLLGGRGGQYGRYAYLYSTFSAPLMIITSILGFIPVLGGCVSAILGIYQIVLAYYATKGRIRPDSRQGHNRGCRPAPAWAFPGGLPGNSCIRRHHLHIERLYMTIIDAHNHLD